jgi:hypothetical protein
MHLNGWFTLRKGLSPPYGILPTPHLVVAPPDRVFIASLLGAPYKVKNDALCGAHACSPVRLFACSPVYPSVSDIVSMPKDVYKYHYHLI